MKTPEIDEITETAEIIEIHIEEPAPKKKKAKKADEAFSRMHEEYVDSFEEVHAAALEEVLTRGDDMPLPSEFYQAPVNPRLKEVLPEWCMDEAGCVREFNGLFAVTEITVDHPIANKAYIVYGEPDLTKPMIQDFASNKELAINAFPDLATNDLGGYTMLEPGQLVTTIAMPSAGKHEEPYLVIYVDPDPSMQLAFAA